VEFLILAPNELEINMDDLEILADAAMRMLESKTRAYSEAFDIEAEAKRYAAVHKSGMPDGYWKPLHVARLEMQTAVALVNALEASSR
jgi:hypothetical protein